jgi:hypothetical protein
MSDQVAHCQAGASALPSLLRAEQEHGANADNADVSQSNPTLQFRMALLVMSSSSSLCVLRHARLNKFSVSNSGTLEAVRRLRAACGGLAGKLLQRSMPDRSNQRSVSDILRRVAALLAAATAEGALVANRLFWGNHEVTQDASRAYALALAASRIQCPHNKGVLGSCYSYGRGVSEDRTRGLELAMQSAASDSCYGSFMLGKCFDAGWGVAQDHDEADLLMQKAASQGHANAQYIQAAKFMDQPANPKTDAIITSLLSAAAAQGHKSAQYKLGVMYYKGRGVARDYNEAARLYRLAAAQGYADAQFNLGYFYEKGISVPRDQEQAVQLYRAAAENGRSNAATLAMRRLGVV